MKFTLYMAQTVNGFIAKENDETPWSDAVWKSYYQIAKQFKAIVLGRRTYEIMKEVDEFEKIGNPLTIVLSSKKEEKDKNATFVRSPHEAIKVLKEKGVAQVLVGGGSRLNASLMKEGLIDEIILDVEPLILGQGIKIFNEGEFEKKLKLKDVKKLSDDVIQLHYEVRK